MDHDSVRPVGDALSISAIIGTFVGWLPEIAAGLSIVWTVIRIYESETVQRFLRRFKRESD